MLLPPRLYGPISECSRNLMLSNTIPGAEVILLITRNGSTDRAGHTVFNTTSGSAVLDGGWEFQAGDLVSAYQRHEDEESSPWPEWIQVQKSVDEFSPGLALTRLRHCSRGFTFGPVARPGAHIELLDGSTVIGTADGSDPNGQAHVSVPSGIPSGAGTLTLRQIICPKPAPVPPAPHYIVDSQLPPAEPFPLPPGSIIPAPVITGGLTHCSRSISIGKIFAGADVTIEETGGRWWATLGPSDAETGVLELPVKLLQEETVTIRQEVSRRCELRSESSEYTVGPQEALGAPNLRSIDCDTVPLLVLSGFKGAADVEISVTASGVEAVHRSVATVSEHAGSHVPAPPMSPGASVRVRQGECGIWSPWSDPPQKVLSGLDLYEPQLPSTSFSCQDAVVIANISPLAGTLRVMSDRRGELARVLPGRAIDPWTVDLGTSLKLDEVIWIEHHVCGQSARSNEQVVQRSVNLREPSLESVFDGDLQIGVLNVNSGARLELWEETSNRLLGSFRAPFDSSPVTTTVLSGFGEVSREWKLHVRSAQCGEYRRSPTIGVGIRTPKLDSISPSEVLPNSGPLALTLRGEYFRPYARVRKTFNGITTWSSTFVSAQQLTAAVPADDLAIERTLYVQIQQGDGGPSSQARPLKIKAPPPPPVVEQRPVIQVVESGPLTARNYVLTGSGFLANQPDSLYGIQIRVVNNAAVTLPLRLHAGSSSTGTVSVDLGAVDLTALVANALRTLVVTFSASDKRMDPTSTSGIENLWSNYVRFEYS